MEDLDEIQATIKALKNNNSIEFFARTANYDKYEAKIKREEQLALADPNSGLEIACIFKVEKDRVSYQVPLKVASERPKVVFREDQEIEDDESDEEKPIRREMVEVIPGLNPRQCQYCFKTLSSKSKLNRHLKIHTEKRYFDCNICLQVFRTQKLYDEHVREHNFFENVDNILEPEVILSDASDEEDEKSIVMEPEVVMDDQEKEEDEYEDEPSSPPSSPTFPPVNNNFTETKPKRYQCSLCPKAFRYSSKLARHQTVHTGEKPFQCDICQKCFTSKYSLKFHLQLHEQTGKYICQICGKAFFNDHVLQRHQAVHSKDAIYTCDNCGRTYKWKNRFVEHLANCAMGKKRQQHLDLL